jgi:hypothetical protein
MFNPKFKQAYAIAKAIPNRPTKEGKRRAILAWCAAVKKALG